MLNIRKILYKVNPTDTSPEVLHWAILIGVSAFCIGMAFYKLDEFEKALAQSNEHRSLMSAIISILN